MAEFFVNRGGGRAPEGPFEEAQIIRWIATKKLTSGDICQVGSQRFKKLSSHPPFAQALREVGVGVPEETIGARLRTSPKSTNRGLLFAAVLSVFGLALAAVAIGSYVMFGNGATPVRAAVPADTELLVEARSLRELLTGLAQLRVVDARALPDAHTFDDVAQALNDAFGLPKAKGRELLLGATTFGVAARKLEESPEFGLFLGFTSSAPMNALLSLERTKYRGLVAKTGRKYTFSAAPMPPTANVNDLRRALLGLHVDGIHATLVWFETSKLLFYGTPSLAEAVAHVLALDVPGLEQSASFKAAQRDLTGSPNVSAYFDPSKLGDRTTFASELLGVDSKKIAPFVGSLELSPAGALTHFVLHSSESTSATASIELDLVPRLPAETIAFVEIDSALSSAERERHLLARVAALDLGAKWADFLGISGDRSALALLATDEFAGASLEPQKIVRGLAFERVFAIKDETALRASVKNLIDQFARDPGSSPIKEEADGYALTTPDGSIAARMRFAANFGMIAVGASALVERASDAFSKREKTLEAEPAYREARAKTKAVNSLYAWLDAGRVATILQGNSASAAEAWPSHEVAHALRLTGPDRLTASIAVERESRANGAVYRIEGVNLPLVATLAALYGAATP